MVEACGGQGENVSKNKVGKKKREERCRRIRMRVKGGLTSVCLELDEAKRSKQERSGRKDGEADEGEESGKRAGDFFWLKRDTAQKRPGGGEKRPSRIISFRWTERGREWVCGLELREFSKWAIFYSSGWGNWNCEIAKAELENSLGSREDEWINGKAKEGRGSAPPGKKTPVFREIECRWLRMMN